MELDRLVALKLTPAKVDLIAVTAITEIVVGITVKREKKIATEIRTQVTEDTQTEVDMMTTDDRPSCGMMKMLVTKKVKTILSMWRSTGGHPETAMDLVDTVTRLDILMIISIGIQTMLMFVILPLVHRETVAHLL